MIGFLSSFYILENSQVGVKVVVSKEKRKTLKV